jgi:aspartyl-tRNA(Asn)/glutamyl-tRNA(Gln) amidotransferase subunit B
MTYEAVIGLEVHVQVKTRSKIFTRVAAGYGHEPNTLTDPVVLALPGTLPVMNHAALDAIIKAGLLLGCDIAPVCKWDRKNYFYPDSPKNYQISQYDQPLCLGGAVEIELPGAARNVMGEHKRIPLTRIHLEEDVGKLNHGATDSLIDFNRAGTPLMEIVSEPELSTPDEAMAFLLALKQILQYGEVSDCNLEQGNIRCDINVSVRPSAAAPLGTKVEIKNMNTFKGVHRALRAEIQRQVREIERGGSIVQETRRWDDESGRTESMRGKENAHDYRYFPEPDLLPVELTEQQLAGWRAVLPELPRARRARLVTEYGLPDYDAGVLVADKLVADFFEAAARASGNAKAASNWVMTEVLRVLSERQVELAALPLTPAALAALIGLVDRKVINMPSAKEIFAVLMEKGGDPEALVKEKGLAQVSDTGAMEAFVEQAVAANPKVVADFQAGKGAALQFLVGQVMKLSRGKANPGLAQELLKKRLG